MMTSTVRQGRAELPAHADAIDMFCKDRCRRGADRPGKAKRGAAALVVARVRWTAQAMVSRNWSVLSKDGTKSGLFD